MCGIAGVLDPRRTRDEPATNALLEKMAGAIVHRGPDGAGTWVDPTTGIGLGHRRLAIIDLTPAGHQPMVSRDGRYVLTYNGEIYNHHDIAAELAAVGTSFRGHSDTEVLIEAISQWGIDGALDRSDGMFALGLWDREERTLLLARDRFGEKPLYYGRLATGEVVFASTVDALRRHPAFDGELDRDALTLYLRHKYVPAPHSIYAGIFKLEPGHLVVVAADGTVGTPRPYWSYFDVLEQAVPFEGDEREATDLLDDLLRRSVRRRLVADVAVGAFLSGGIDSSTIVAIAQQESSQPLRTYTIGSVHRDYDESDAARAVAAHLGTTHTEQIVTGEDAIGLVDRMGGMYDEPFGDSSQIPTFAVSRLARSEVTVSLSGDAGDELFGGYNRYTSVPSLRQRSERVPAPLRRAGVRLGSLPPSWWDRLAGVVPERRRPQQLALKIEKALDVVGAATPHEAFLRLVTHWPDPAALVIGGVERPTMHTDRSRWPAVDGIVPHMMAVDAVTYLPDDILVKVDRATMAVSLEGRVPLLDRDVVEFAARLPMDFKIRPGRSKWLLREVLDRYVPRELVDRPKSGFGLPIDEWLRGPLHPWAEDVLFSAEVGEHLHLAPLRTAWAEHQSGRRNHAYALWDVVMFGAWLHARPSVQTAVKA